MKIRRSAPPSQRTVLVVDDQPEVRRVLRRILEADGHVVYEAGDGAAAIAICESHAPDGVVLDISMRGMNGVAAMRPISVASPRAKILVLTSHFDMADEATAMGAHAFLPKTSTAKAIGRTVRELLSSDS